MKSKKALSILLAAALTTATAGCGGGVGGDASSATAVEMRIQRQAGTVTLSNDKGENVTLMEKMRLNAGHNLDTAKESFVMVSFDETKVMTLEENGSASVVQKGNTLQFDVKKGNAFVNLTEELKGDQAVEVRSGNMVCGMTGTSIQIGKDKDGKDTILVTETDNPDGVSITVTDQNGNVTFHLDAKPGEKLVLQDDTGTVDKTNYDLEDLSVTSLYVIGQYPELVQKTAETFNVPADHISTLSKLVSTEGQNAGPLNGAAAEVMEKALKETKGATGNALNAEESILTNTRQLLDKVMEGQMTDEEKKNLLNTANEQMNNVVKAALDAGVQGEDLNNIAKNVAESIANVASTAIDQGKSVTEITEQTKTTGTNLGTAVTRNGNNGAAMAQAIEQIRNTTAQQPAPQPTLQPAQNPAPAQPQTPQAELPPQEEPQVVDDDDDDDDDYDYSGGSSYTPPASPTPSSSAAPSEPTSSIGEVTGGDAEAGYSVRLPNGATGTLWFHSDDNSTSMLTIYASPSTPIVLPISFNNNGSTVTSYNGSPAIVSSINQISIEGAVSNITIKTANTTCTGSGAQITARVTPGSMAALTEFKDLIEGNNPLSSIAYGDNGVVVTIESNNTPVFQIPEADPAGIPSFSIDTTLERMIITFGQGSDALVYHLFKDGHTERQYQG